MTPELYARVVWCCEAVVWILVAGFALDALALVVDVLRAGRDTDE